MWCACDDVTHRSVQAMLQQLPEYTQCYLRLACIAQQCGHEQEAVDWIQQALQRSPDSPDALCLLGTLSLNPCNPHLHSTAAPRIAPPLPDFPLQCDST